MEKLRTPSDACAHEPAALDSNEKMQHHSFALLKAYPGRLSNHTSKGSGPHCAGAAGQRGPEGTVWRGLFVPTCTPGSERLWQTPGVEDLWVDKGDVASGEAGVLIESLKSCEATAS